MNQVLTLDVGGRPSRWSRWEDALLALINGNVAWSLGEHVPYRGGLCRATGEETVIHVPNIIAVTNEVLDGRIALTNPNLGARDLWVCGYCGCKLTRQTITRDHIVPRVQGGLDLWSNVVAACAPCNGRKGGKTPEQAGMQLLWVPYVPNKAEGLILSGRNIQPDQQSYLTDCLPHNSPLRKRFA